MRTGWMLAACRSVIAAATQQRRHHQGWTRHRVEPPASARTDHQSAQYGGQAGLKPGGARAWRGAEQTRDPARVRPGRGPAARRQYPAAYAATRTASSNRTSRPNQPERSGAGRSATKGSGRAAGCILCWAALVRWSDGSLAEVAARPPTQSDPSTNASANHALMLSCCRFICMAVGPYCNLRRTPTKPQPRCRSEHDNRVSQVVSPAAIPVPSSDRPLSRYAIGDPRPEQ
jgi:hypothetical protein